MPTYGPPPVQFVRGEGSRLWDAEGNTYLDFLSGLAVTSLGHSHPAVADALDHQARTLLHVSNLFGTEPGWEVAATLDRLLGGGGQVFFTNSGAEANECALKLARKWGGRGRHVVVSTLGSFHGRTLATLHATGQPAKHEAFQPLPEGFRHVAWNDLAALEAALDPTVAAVLLEPVQGEGGVNPATTEYVTGVRRLCDERGLLFMVDEVQTGLGRTGAWFGHQHFGVVPDVVTMAKALGNGVPIGACWARADLAGVFEPGDHATTFGGQGGAGRHGGHRHPDPGPPGGGAVVRRPRGRPPGRRGAGPRAAPGRATHRGRRCPHRGRRRPAAGPGGQRRHPQRAAPRPLPARHRRGDRRGHLDPDRRL
jgi:acetylornithine/succinyldiaminopimelate/putrescine aminotransferase